MSQVKFIGKLLVVFTMMRIRWPAGLPKKMELFYSFTNRKNLVQKNPTVKCPRQGTTRVSRIFVEASTDREDYTAAEHYKAVALKPTSDTDHFQKLSKVYELNVDQTTQHRYCVLYDIFPASVFFILGLCLNVVIINQRRAT